MSVPLPRRLADSPTVGILAPSGFLPEPGRIPHVKAQLESLGCRVVLDPRLGGRWKYFSAPDDARLASFHAMLDHPGIDIVMAARGGYGLTRLLPDLDFAAVARSDKIFVGFSDFTAFQLAALARASKVSFAGPMALADFIHEEPSAFTQAHFWPLLRSASHRVDDIACVHPYPPEEIRGIVWGGNLSLVTHLMGTPYFPEIHDGILFIEDVNEQPYHLERMLFQLLHAGVLGRQRALLFGQFEACEPGAKSQAPYTLEDVIQTMRERLGFPVLTGFPFGHVKDKITVPVGGRARLDIRVGGYSVEFSEYNASLVPPRRVPG